MLKQSIVAGLLCLSGQAFANITVTTTEDVVKDDDQCSLREAITYANEYLTAKADETESEKATREAIKNAGYNGCGDENATASILLTAKETYTLNAEVKITSALTIQTESTVFNAEATAIGLENATIKAAGQHRLFNVNDGDADISQITVKFTQVNLQGCGSDTICAAQGGIIFNRENLTLEHVKLFDGFANEGGAIYSDGIITGTNGNSASFVNITNSLIQKGLRKLKWIIS